MVTMHTSHVPSYRGIGSVIGSQCFLRVLMKRHDPSASRTRLGVGAVDESVDLPTFAPAWMRIDKTSTLGTGSATSVVISSHLTQRLDDHHAAQSPPKPKYEDDDWPAHDTSSL